MRSYSTYNQRQIQTIKTFKHQHLFKTKSQKISPPLCCMLLSTTLVFKICFCFFSSQFMMNWKAHQNAKWKSLVFFTAANLIVSFFLKNFSLKQTNKQIDSKNLKVWTQIIKKTSKEENLMLVKTEREKKTWKYRVYIESN